MNLATDPWIPIVWEDGRSALVSLTGAFSGGGQIRDLAVRPHERIALMRLLICVAQAALDGPTDDADWKACRPRIVEAVPVYLDRFRPAFELFGEGQRFLQISDLKKPPAKGKTAQEDDDDDEGNLASKLDLALATGNNPTLFDNAGGSKRSLAPEKLACDLLTFQCFSPGGTIGRALWNGILTGKGVSSEAAPCLAGNMLHALVRGRDLLETIHLNLLSHRQVKDLYGEKRWGRPVWEQFPDGPAQSDAVRNATETYLGRLVPLTRAVRLGNDCDTMVLANGLGFGSYPEWREPTATVVVQKMEKKEEERVLLHASLDKALWRELHSLTVLRRHDSGVGGPVALQNVSDDRAFDLWVGGLVANKSKLLDTVEAVFHVPVALLGSDGQKRYGAGVKHAEEIEWRLRRAVGAYRKELGDDLDRAEMREQRKRVQHKATLQFWTDVECRVGELLAVVDKPEVLGLGNTWHETDWGKTVWRAARAAYESACPHGTPRQMKAYVLGCTKLYGSETENGKQTHHGQPTKPKRKGRAIAEVSAHIEG